MLHIQKLSRPATSLPFGVTRIEQFFLRSGTGHSIPGDSAVEILEAGCLGGEWVVMRFSR
jgi:hypothetical protein